MATMMANAEGAVDPNPEDKFRRFVTCLELYPGVLPTQDALSPLGKAYLEFQKSLKAK